MTQMGSKSSIKNADDMKISSDQQTMCIPMLLNKTTNAVINKSRWQEREFTQKEAVPLKNSEQGKSTDYFVQIILPTNNQFAQLCLKTIVFCKQVINCYCHPLETRHAHSTLTTECSAGRQFPQHCLSSPAHPKTAQLTLFILRFPAVIL